MKNPIIQNLDPENVSQKYFVCHFHEKKFLKSKCVDVVDCRVVNWSQIYFQANKIFPKLLGSINGKKVLKNPFQRSDTVFLL